MNAEIYEPLWANTAPSILKSNYKTSNLSHKQQELSSLGFLTILPTHHSLQPGSSSLPCSLGHPNRPGRRTGGHPGYAQARAADQRIPRAWQSQQHQAQGTFELPWHFSAAKPHLAASGQVFHLPVLFMKSPGRQKLGNNQSPPRNHSVMEPGRQLVATPSKQTAQWEKRWGFFLRAEAFGLCFLCSPCKIQVKIFSCIMLN